ncbi:MAG: TIGR03435 family protein [Candidatus Sulfopaludibacter sp.]|nr:TIGR03435 family protein [Candidatus Sulfopaludibacter sp.]
MIRIALLLFAGPLFGAQPAFEVASVKAAVEPVRQPMFCIGPCAFGERMTVTGTRVDIRYMSLYNLIVAAFRVQPNQLSGPDWMRSQHFDVAARIPAGLSKNQLPEMLQSLLAVRFKLAVHRDRAEQPVYALVVGKGGPKLQQSTADAKAPPPSPPGSKELYSPQGEGRVLENGDIAIGGGEYGAIRGGRGSGGGMRFEFQTLTMPALAEILTPHLDRPVIDRTNLKGAYQLVSENRPPAEAGGGGRKGGQPGADTPDSGPPPDVFVDGLFAALQKAGLKLEKTKAPVEMIVVDRLEKTPAAN